MLYIRATLVSTILLVLTAGQVTAADDESNLRAIYNAAVRYTAAIEFPNLVSGDPVLGQAQFGVAADDRTIDTSHALFQGTSVIAGSVVSNGTACSTCHRPNNRFSASAAAHLDAHAFGRSLNSGQKRRGARRSAAGATV